MPIAIGALVALLSLVGCCVTLAENKCMMCCYGLLQLLFGVLIVASGVGLVIYSDYMDDIADTPVNELDGGLGDAKHYLSDFFTGTYNACCEEFVPAAAMCPAASNGIDGYCFRSEDAFDDGNNTPTDACLLFTDNDQLNWCPETALANGVGLKIFQEEAADYAEDNLYPAGIALIIFGSLLFLACVGSFHLSCRNNDGGAHKDTGKPQTRQQNTTGENASYGVART